VCDECVCVKKDRGSEVRETRGPIEEDVWCGELICVIKDEGRAELCGVYRLQQDVMGLYMCVNEVLIYISISYIYITRHCRFTHWFVLFVMVMCVCVCNPPFVVLPGNKVNNCPNRIHQSMWRS
jgi:hypothetical protein